MRLFFHLFYMHHQSIFNTIIKSNTPGLNRTNKQMKRVKFRVLFLFRVKAMLNRMISKCVAGLPHRLAGEIHKIRSVIAHSINCKVPIALDPSLLKSFPISSPCLLPNTKRSCKTRICRNHNSVTKDHTLGL